MRINLWKAILVAACALAMTGVSQTRAGDLAKEDQIEAAPPPPPPNGPMHDKEQFELTPEQTNRLLAELKEKNPQKADELTKLREKDPNAFKAELRNATHEQFMSRMMEQVSTMPGPGAEIMRKESRKEQMSTSNASRKIILMKQQNWSRSKRTIPSSI